ncbi:MAG: glycosyltransferase [Muribaculaceae bacterium]|nr:glycosyltransferase [Muribaculaceae bacterium]
MHIIDTDVLSNGIVTVVRELSIAQRNIGHHTISINVRKNSIYIQDFEQIRTKKLFRHKLKEYNPDIVVFHGLLYTKILSLSSIVFENKIPYLLMPHGAYSEMNYEKNKIKKYLFKHIFLSSPIKHSQGWIFLNEAEKNNFTLPNKSKSIIIPNGCYPQENFTPNNEIIKILFIGRFDIFHKGLDLLIDGINAFLMQNDNNLVEFDFYGEGTSHDLSFLRKKIANIPKIKIHNPVFGQEKTKVFIETDIIILTSRLEGFPMSILEGWSYGIPSIVSEGTNISDIVVNNNCGWVIEKNENNSIANTIATAVNQYKENKYNIRSNAFTTALKFQWNNIAKISIENYNSIIQNYQNR